MTLLRRTVLPLVLITASPLLMVLLWFLHTHRDGSVLRLVRETSVTDLWHAWPWPTPHALAMLLGFATFEAALLVLLPGARILGPLTPAGDRSTYKDNGLFAWAVTHLAFYLGAYRFGWFSPTVLYDQLGPLTFTASALAIAACGLVYLKGRNAPGTADAATTGNAIFDFFWGVEIDPHVAGYSLKQYANCRLGMMGWSLLVWSFAAKQRAIYGHVSSAMVVVAALQLVYIAKFFVIERVYFSTLDVMHDRFGFYILWGVLGWLPVVYPSPALYLVNHPIELHPLAAVGLVVVGLVAIYVTHDADRQRQAVRRARGRITVWGRMARVIIAEYRTLDGRRNTNLLLASGWWGVSRHFHYLAELALAAAWSLPCGLHHAAPYFYLVYLTILLVDRAVRDDRRCRTKYGPAWERYCALVPSRILPGVF